MCARGSPGLPVPLRGWEGVLVLVVQSGQPARGHVPFLLGRDAPCGAGWHCVLGLIPSSSSALCLRLTHARGGFLVTSAAGEGKRKRYHVVQKRLLMDPLNNQPNSLFVCKVGTFSTESRLNIGPRVGTRQRGLSSCGIVFFPWRSTLYQSWTGGHPELSGNRLVFLFNQGLICKFHTPPAVWRGLSFSGCSVGVFVQCFYTSNCLIPKTAHAGWLSLASWLEAAAASFFFLESGKHFS